MGGARDAAKCLQGLGQPLLANNFLTQNDRSTEAEKPCCRSTISCVSLIKNNLLNGFKNRSEAVRKGHGHVLFSLEWGVNSV